MRLSSWHSLNNNNNRLFVAPHRVRAWSAYKDVRICTFCHARMHPPHTLFLTHILDTCTPTHACMHTRMHACTHTHVHARTHKHTYTCTHTQYFILIKQYFAVGACPLPSDNLLLPRTSGWTTKKCELMYPLDQVTRQDNFIVRWQLLYCQVIRQDKIILLSGNKIILLSGDKKDYFIVRGQDKTRVFCCEAPGP